jgi:hypothetical protein
VQYTTADDEYCMGFGNVVLNQKIPYFFCGMEVFLFFIDVQDEVGNVLVVEEKRVEAKDVFFADDNRIFCFLYFIENLRYF